MQTLLPHQIIMNFARTSFVALSMTFSFLFLASTESVSAKQYVRHVQGREVVVHTNPIPVVLHRLVPPQHGRHVTEQEIRRGRVPSGRR